MIEMVGIGEAEAFADGGDGPVAVAKQCLCLGDPAIGDMLGCRLAGCGSDPIVQMIDVDREATGEIAGFLEGMG